MSHSPERRGSKRDGTTLDVEVSLPGQQERVTGRIVNLSDGGCFLLLPVFVARGDELDLCLRVPAGDHPVELSGRVVHVIERLVPEGRFHFGVGVAFSNAEPRTLEAMRAAAAAVSKDPQA